MPKISIVVPIHNMQDYLRESLDSAVGQTLEDIEVICVDDGSTDKTAAILREYAKLDSRVRVITHRENKSASQARKDGALAADGEYLMFLDADDALDLDACERLYASVRDAPVDILHFGMVIANEGNLPQSTVDWLEEFVTPYDGVLGGSEILEACFSENRLYSFSLPGKLFSTSLCKKAFSRVRDGRFPIGEDKYAYFVLSYYAQTYRGMKDAALYHYCLGRGVTGHDVISLSQFEEFCSMGLVADAIRGFLVEEGALQQHEATYLHARKELLMNCVANWSTRLTADDKLAGFALMQTYWEASEILARIAEVVVPRVSIIVPVHNMQDYLRESLDSAVGQTMPDIEVICVDDHSADASADIIREYAERDPRVRVITFPENRSVSAARKDGVLVANGEYIMFLDADDALVPDACERLYATMRHNPVDILHFGTLITNEKKLPRDRMDWLRGFISPFDGELRGSDILEGCFSQELYNFSLWDKLYSADLCKKAFSRIRDGKLPLGEDKYAYLLLSYFAQTYRGMPDVTCYVYHFGRGVTGHNLISLEKFETRCMMALAADAIREFLVEEDALSRYEEMYAGVRGQLLFDCVANWNKHLSAEDRSAGYDLMLQYWQAPEVIAKIAELNWAQQGHIARLLKGSASVANRPRQVRTIGTYYHRIGNGGAERILSILIGLWKELGYKVVLFTDDPPSRDDYDLPAGVSRVVLPSFFTVEPGTYLERARALEHTIKAHDIDVMVYHAWVSPILLWDLMVCKAAGVAFVSHCHSVFSHLARSAAPSFADMPPIYHLCDAVITLSEVDRVYWSSFNDNVVSVINPFTFDLDELEVSPLESKNIIWLGRMSDEKRPHDALRIFAKVLMEEPDAKLFMVGSCEHKSYMDGLYLLIDKLGIRDAVVMAGFHRDVLPFYRMASVFLMTSEFEGFSMVISESQSLGMPCVMYDLPYLTLTSSRKGFIGVEMGDLNAAADGVVELLRDPEYRRSLGREARSNVEELSHFDYAGVWHGIFDGLSQPTLERPLDETTRIMWDTLMDHYRTGVVHRNLKIDRRTRQLAAAKRASKKERRAIDKLRASWSFKIGHAITSFPRRIRRSLSRRGFNSGQSLSDL